VIYGTVNDEEALRAFTELSRLEGIIPALESSHALAFCRNLLADPDYQGDLIMLNLSGRGDKDMDGIGEVGE
jgi:tryptophan synthase beta subunit